MARRHALGDDNPLVGQVVYVTAYVLEKPYGAPSDKFGDMKAVPLRTVGVLPRDFSFGSDMMYHLIAAVPVRRERMDLVAMVTGHLAVIIRELGAYGKIFAATEYPLAHRIELPNGRWIPVQISRREWPGIVFVNGYNENRYYGGPEEGGWWYDEGDPIASIPAFNEEEKQTVLDWHPDMVIREEAAVPWSGWTEYLKDEAGWHSPYPLSSVLGHDNFSMKTEEHIALPFPEETPHYE